MYRPKPKAVVILEETFVLLKPDAAEHHGAIIDAMREAGFFVMSRQMPSTRALIEEIVEHFGDVAALRREAERIEELNASTYSGARRASRRESNASSAQAAFGSPIHSSFVSGSGGSSTGNFGPSRRLSNAVDGGRGPAAGGTNTLSRFMSDRTMLGVDDSLLPSWEAVKREHVDHLLRGTCIAIAVSASNAVERVAKFCGPEDPDVAKASVPQSLRAKYGRTVVENAVFCAPDHRAAGDLIYRVFGYEPQVRTEALAEGADARGGAGAQRDDPSAAAEAERGSDTHQAMLVHPGAHLSGVEFHATASEATPGPDSVTDLADISTPAQVRVAREKLVQEREELKREAELLRQREVDLLLREEKFAAQMEELRRAASSGPAAIVADADGGAGRPAAAPRQRQPHLQPLAPAPPPRRGGPLRGAPVSGHDADLVGNALPAGDASRAIDHRLTLRPKARSRHALQAAHLRSVIPERRVAAADLTKELRDVRKAIEMATSEDHTQRADYFVSALWTAVREQERETERIARVAAAQTASTPASPGLAPIEGLSPKASRATFSRHATQHSREFGPSQRSESVISSRAASPGGLSRQSGSPQARGLSPQSQTMSSVRGPSDDAMTAANAVLTDTFARFFGCVAEREVARWTEEVEALEDKLEKAEAHITGLERELKTCEAKPQYVDVDGVEALADLSATDLQAIVGSPGTITSLFLRFDGARENGRMQKADFIRFYERCAAFRDTGIVDDSRRVREAVHNRYSPGKPSLSLDEFTALLLWAVNR